MIGSDNNQIVMSAIYDGMLLVAEILWVILKIFYNICVYVCKLLVPKKEKNVAGEIVLVTGAGHGIGKALAIGYASLGATVVCWDINEENNNQTMNEIKKMGNYSVYAYQCDLRDKEKISKVAEEVRKEVGDVTILVNNAGIAFAKNFLDQSVSEITSCVDVNMTAHYWTLQAFLPNMIKKNHGHVLAVSSLLAFIGVPYGTIYCTTKFAVRGFMEALREELRARSKGKSLIKFTTVYPSLVLTGIVKKPKFRFPNLIRGLSPQEAASLIINAQRKNFKERAIPSYWLPIFKLLSMIPRKILHSIMDFLDMTVYPDD